MNEIIGNQEFYKQFPGGFFDKMDEIAERTSALFIKRCAAGYIGRFLQRFPANGFSGLHLSAEKPDR